MACPSRRPGWAGKGQAGTSSPACGTAIVTATSRRACWGRAAWPPVGLAGCYRHTPRSDTSYGSCSGCTRIALSDAARSCDQSRRPGSGEQVIGPGGAAEPRAQSQARQRAGSVSMPGRCRPRSCRGPVGRDAGQAPARPAGPQPAQQKIEAHRPVKGEDAVGDGDAAVVDRRRRDGLGPVHTPGSCSTRQRAKICIDYAQGWWCRP